MPAFPGSNPGSPAIFANDILLECRISRASLTNQLAFFIEITESFFSEHGFAVVAELVDAPDLGSGAARCESSSLSDRTMNKRFSVIESRFSKHIERRVTKIRVPSTGLSPSGKAPAFDAGIPWFESR